MPRPHEPVRYRSYEEDSRRWTRFPFREGDIVVSTRSKCGTTWMQQICLSLVHGTPDLPAPLAELSPWIDWLTEPEDELFARLEVHSERRVLKTHTSLDGVVIDPRARYLVVVRDPLDAAVSRYHQAGNLDRVRLAELTGREVHVPAPQPPLDAWLAAWVREPVEVTDRAVTLDTLPGMVHHARDAWSRRSSGLVRVVGYADLVDDLEGRMRDLASWLGVSVPEERWPALVRGARFDTMASDAERRVPDRRGVFIDPGAFFRRGRPGAGREVLGPADLSAYEARMRTLVPEPEVRRLLGVDD